MWNLKRRSHDYQAASSLKNTKTFSWWLFRNVWTGHYVIADVSKEHCAIIFNGVEAQEETVTRSHMAGEWLPQPHRHGNLKMPKHVPALYLPVVNFLMSCLTFMKLDTRLCCCTSPRWNILKMCLQRSEMTQHNHAYIAGSRRLYRVISAFSLLWI